MAIDFDPASLRKARLALELSQAQLAELVGVSQASISYYERNRVAPPHDVRVQLQRVLGLSDGQLEVLRAPSAGTDSDDVSVRPPRERWLNTLSCFCDQIAWLDRPADADGGDLALAVDRGSHGLLAVLDASGSGRVAAASAAVLAGVAMGAMRAGEGIPWPEDVVKAVHEAARGLLDEDVALTVLSLERRSRRIRLCRLAAPPPFVRSGRVGHWPGKPEGPVGSYVDERQLEPSAMIVVGTDGAADLPTRARGRRGLWESPDFRTVLARADEPDEVVRAARARHAEAPQPTDDLLLIAVQLKGPR